MEAAIRRVLSRGQFILGPEVARFEEEFARFCRVSHGVGLASGTDALELALRGLKIGPGDLVATVSFTFLSTADAIRKVGAQPLFVDIDPATYTMDPAHLELLLKRMPASRRRRIRALLPVHLYGHPCDMGALGRIARREGWPVVEDCAQAHGAEWGSKRVGGFGQIGCFSFYPTKNLGALGDGGMAVTSSGALADRLRMLRFQGRKGKDLQLFDGLNSRLDELQAAILRVKLPSLDGWTRSRRRLAGLYAEGLRSLPVQLPVEAAGARHVYHLFCIQATRREDLRKWLARRGIGTGIHYAIPVHRQPLYRSGESRPLPLPVTERVSRRILSLPLFPEMTAGEVTRVCRAVTEQFSRR
ncbi:MAG: DegT/DnrJ/EryC1/StrS family aminotransferase [Candidatus Omnitrophica bacterium]|nr:DegT/DnrJ/EryC1/StrS family aminotransferase [Candidatus Omnitrophota bacterium]